MVLSKFPLKHVEDFCIIYLIPTSYIVRFDEPGLRTNVVENKASASCEQNYCTD